MLISRFECGIGMTAARVNESLQSGLDDDEDEALK